MDGGVEDRAGYSGWNSISKFTNMLSVLYAFRCLFPAKNVNKNALQIAAMLYVGMLYVLYVSKRA